MTRIERRADPVAVDRILRALPSWFGIESAIQEYVAEAAVKPSYLAISHDSVVGIALISRHYPESAELFLIAVDPEHRSRGVGSALIDAIESDLAADGVTMLQVKTVGESFEDAGYAATRAFYRARGFVPLQELSNIDWDGPTLISVKQLG